MTDIVERLRGLRFVHVPAASGLMEEAAAEIASLREAIRRLAEQDATLSVQGGSVTVTMDATLTDEERAAIKTVIGGFGMWVAQNGLTDKESLRLAVVTLFNLLERLHT